MQRALDQASPFRQSLGMPNPAAAPISQAEIESRVLYRDAMILVIDKPTGMPVHAGFGGGPNLEQSFVHLTFGLPRAPSLAHRLDRDTSGCLVLGRHSKALRQVGDLFASGKVRKTYWAIVDGRPKEDEGRIKLALAKITGQGAGWKMRADPNGQPAITDYKVRGSVETPDGVRSWMEFHPHTGRTHQIRVHAALLDCPVFGDRIYGREGVGGGQLMLHARAVTLPLYAKRDPIRVRAPAPAHMIELLKACGFKGDTPEKQED
jgi:tRNA pseudouridine32 synthase/23S rRNA pseudouridine746 synthase/23S rRNA pseudouridine1911/1915/1917 synthase